MRTVFHYVSLLRVPILFFAVGVVLSWHPKRIRSLLRGTFDAKLIALPTVILAALVYSATLSLCAIAILEGAPARTGVPALDGWFAQRVTVSFLSWREVPLKNIWLLIVGLALIPTILCAIRLIRASDSGRGIRTMLCLGTLAAFVPLTFAYSPDYWGYESSARAMAGVFRFDPQGYVDPQSGQLGRFHVYSAHCIFLIFAQLALYLTIVQVQLRRGKTVPKWLLRWDSFPVLYSVYSMLGLVCLLLSGLGFFLDGYGFSLLVVLAVWRSIVWYFDTGSTVGFFKPAIELPTPREVLAANSAETGGRVIVVCASGGGIHAAAWTTRVLTGLETLNRGGFAAMVRVLSAVSGGSVGAMNFAGVYGPSTGQIAGELLDRPNELSRLSSLPAALGGWFLFDLPRLFIPWLPSWLNRGWALERRWDLDGDYNWSLGLWGYQARLGRRPAVLFNCTAVETGKPVVFGSSKLTPRIHAQSAPSGDQGYSPSFHELTNSQVDVMVPTAARLSATFPFVSPASRLHGAAKASPDLSYVDGGYYDNFGVTTAIEFLNHAFSKTADDESKLPDAGRAMLAKLSPPVPIQNVLVIEIRAAATSEPKCGRVRFEQLVAPVRAILAVRSAAQRLRNDTELQLAKEAFAGRGVKMDNVIFTYPDIDIPLSWHLTEDDVTRIDDEWHEGFVKEKQAVAAFCQDPVRLPLPVLETPDSAPTPAS